MHRVPSHQHLKKNPESRGAYRTKTSFSGIPSLVGSKPGPRERFMTVQSTVDSSELHVFTHANDYPLASTRLIKEIIANDLCMTMLNVQDVSLDDILLYKAVVDSRKTKLTSRLLNTYKQAMISIAEGKLHILSLPSASKRGKKNHTKQIKLSSFSHRRNSGHSSMLSKNSKETQKKPSLNREQSIMSAGTEDDFGTSVSFALSHIYDIEYARNGSKEFTVSFYYPKEDSDDPPTSNYQLIHLTFKADTSDKAVAWIKHILCGVQASAHLALAFAEQLQRDMIRNPDSADIVSKTLCEDLLRLHVDLWSLVRGFNSAKVAEAITKLVEFIRKEDVGKKRVDEALFWEAQIESVLAAVEKGKNELATSFLELVREEVETSGIL